MPDLTQTEVLVISGYGAATPVAEIGVRVNLQPESVVSLATRLRKRGYYLPYFKPVTVNPPRPPPPRFPASPAPELHRRQIFPYLERCSHGIPHIW